MTLGRILVLALLGAMVACQRLPSAEDDDDRGDDDTTGAFPAEPMNPSSGTTSLGATGGLDSSGGEDGSFFPDPDPPCGTVEGEPWHCLPVECDILEQTYCEEGEKCTAWANDGGSWNATRCVPVAEDPAAPGETCRMEGSAVSGLDDCDATSMCWFVDGDTLEGRCVPFCSGDWDAPVCPDGLACMTSNDRNLVLCLPTCDPLAGDCESPDAQCTWADDGFFCSARGEGLAAGEACNDLNACAEGLACGAAEFVAPSCDQGAYGCCTPLCDITAPDPTAPCFDPAQQCVPWWPEEAPPGQENLGACALPS